MYAVGAWCIHVLELDTWQMYIVGNSSFRILSNSNPTGNAYLQPMGDEIEPPPKHAHDGNPEKL